MLSRWVLPLRERLSLQLAGRVVGALVFRIVCYSAMLWLALWNEARPAPGLPDVILSHVPYLAWIERYNYVIWLFAYLPLMVALLVHDAERFIRYSVTSGLVALVRGVCIAATGLGPVRGADINAGVELSARVDAFLHLLSPVAFFSNKAPSVYLTKDLFFSGHASTTFLILLYVWRYPRLRAAAIASHIVVVTSVVFAHLHYTIDIIGAYGMTFLVFFLREGNLRALLHADTAASNRLHPDRA